MLYQLLLGKVCFKIACRSGKGKRLVKNGSLLARFLTDVLKNWTWKRELWAVTTCTPIDVIPDEHHELGNPPPLTAFLKLLLLLYLSVTLYNMPVMGGGPDF